MREHEERKRRRKEGGGEERRRGGRRRKNERQGTRKCERGERQKRSERKRAQSVAEEAERWEGCWFQKGRIKEEGLQIVQPKNNENRGREGASEREGARGWPLTRGHYRKGDYGCSKLSKHSPRDPS